MRYVTTFEGSYAGDAGGGYSYPPSSSPLGTTWPDGTSVTLGSTSGSMLGTAPTQKLGFWGKTPVVRPAALTVSGAAVSGTAGAAYTATEQGIINALVTLANNLKTRLDQLETRNQSIGILS